MIEDATGQLFMTSVYSMRLINLIKRSCCFGKLAEGVEGKVIGYPLLIGVRCVGWSATMSV